MIISLIKRINKRLKYEVNAYYTNRSLKYYQGLLGKHQGRSGFIIGNGPSLKMEDLESLKSEITIASNRIYLAFSKTNWRPNYYTNISKLQYPIYEKEILKNFDKIHLAAGIRPSYKRNRTYQVKQIGTAVNNTNNNSFSGNMIDGVFGGYSVTYFNLQLAIHLGLNPIYLIGMDHYYKGQTNNPEPDSIIKTTREDDHFIKGYRKKSDSINPAIIENIDLAFKHCKYYAEKNNIQIFNASRGGRLEIFERIDFDSIF
jgi:hypothetical protein